MPSLFKYLIAGTTISTTSLFFICQNYYQIPLNNPLLKSTLGYLHSMENKDRGGRWSTNILYFLVRWNLVTNFDLISDQWIIDLREKIIKSQYDVEGVLMEGWDRLGAGGVEIGPISFRAAEDCSNLGIQVTKSNILTFRDQNPKSNLQIGLNLTSDKQVIEYTPYIIPQNIGNSLKQILPINKQFPKLSYISLNLDQLQNLEVNTSQLQQKLIKISLALCQQSKTSLYFIKNKQYLEYKPALNNKKKRSKQNTAKKQEFIEQKAHKMQNKVIGFQDVIKMIVES